MTTIAVDIKAIDVALIARYSGLQIYTGNPSALTEVEIFMEEPDPEEYPERVYPSVVLSMIDILPNFEDFDTEDEMEEEITYNPALTPPERGMRERPKPFRITYSLSTWHRARAGESRDLVSLALIQKTAIRGYINVPNVDASGTQDLWVLWSGSISKSDERRPDEIIYHKTLTIDVIAYLLQSAVDAIVSKKVVTQVDWKVYSKEDSGNVLDQIVTVTEDGEEGS